MINMLIVLFGLTMLYMAATSRIKAHIKMLSVQGLILFLILFLDNDKTNFITLAFLSMETLLVKTILIPLFLTRVLNKNEVFRDNEPDIPNFYSLVIASVILFAGFILSNLHGQGFEKVTPLFFGVSISTILMSLFLITTRKKILTHVIGYIMMENGIFLLSLSVAKEMPIVVSLGVLLDVFIAVFILGFLVNKINTAFEELNICDLCNLRDCDCND
jgi:hydrogenase-4 component E